jgi:hypothetical protein
MEVSNLKRFLIWASPVFAILLAMAVILVFRQQSPVTAGPVNEMVQANQNEQVNSESTASQKQLDPDRFVLPTVEDAIRADMALPEESVQSDAVVRTADERPISTDPLDWLTTENPIGGLE